MLRARNLKESFRFAFEGMAYALKTQRNMRIHVVVAFVVLCLGLWLKVKLAEGILLGVMIVFVMVAELFNTAIEGAVDLACPHEDPLAKVVKDVSAAAVLFTAGGSALAGLLILGPYLYRKLVGLT